jgi:hypothetical protein
LTGTDESRLAVSWRTVLEDKHNAEDGCPKAGYLEKRVVSAIEVGEDAVLIL